MEDTGYRACAGLYIRMLCHVLCWRNYIRKHRPEGDIPAFSVSAQEAEAAGLLHAAEVIFHRTPDANLATINHWNRCIKGAWFDDPEGRSFYLTTTETPKTDWMLREIHFYPMPDCLPASHIVSSLRREARASERPAAHQVFEFEGFRIESAVDLATFLVNRKAEHDDFMEALIRWHQNVLRHGDAPTEAISPATSSRREQTTPETFPCSEPHAEPLDGASSGRSAVESKFTGGQLALFEDRAELRGVKIMTDRNTGQIMMLLRELAKRRADGRWVRCSGESLARAIGAESSGVITSAVATLRKNIVTRLKRDLNILCERNDFLVNDEQGYHLNDWITLAGEQLLPASPKIEERVPQTILNRRKRIAEELHKDGVLTAVELARRLRASERTITRDLDAMQANNEVGRESHAKTGAYHLVSSQRRAG